MNNKLNISIFTNNDTIWNLPLWHKTIKNLKKDYNINSFFVFPDIIDSGKKGFSVPLWYLNTYGFKNFCILSLFAISRYTQFIFRKKIFSFKHLSRKNNIPYFEFDSPNNNKVTQIIKKYDTDIILILTTHILKKEILNSPNIGIINKHCSILPSCKGVMPFFWAKLKKLPVGISFYKVERKINTGKILYQEEYRSQNASMVKFYKYAFKIYPEKIKIAISNLINNKSLKSDIKSNECYFSYPDKKDFKEFSRKNRIIQLKDIL